MHAGDDDDDDEEFYAGLYEDGHWEWNELKRCLVFESDILLTETYEQPTPIAIGCIEFKTDLDLLEQHRFRKRFQRKLLPDDVVTLQDIKDVVLFTAPKAVLTASVVNILHLPTTERFLRALIEYCQYYLQISDEMGKRIIQFKIRTPKSEEIELKFRENLQDLRLLVAKEYCAVLIGAQDFAKYHHMGPNKKTASLSKNEAVLFESILRMATEMVWLALGRKSYDKIELEIHRMFKSDIFNMIQHKLNTNCSMDPKEIFVLFGHCLKQNRMTNSHSPLMNEVSCNRGIDYQLMGLGVVKYNWLNQRLRFFEHVLITPETKFKLEGISMGILGLPRVRFDIMLNELKIHPVVTSSSASMRFSPKANISKSTSSCKTVVALYEDICIPDKEDQEETLPDHFPTEYQPRKRRNAKQRKKWLAQAKRLTGSHH